MAALANFGLAAVLLLYKAATRLFLAGGLRESEAERVSDRLVAAAMETALVGVVL